jgi:transketolase
MGAILTGIALHGGTRPYGGTYVPYGHPVRPLTSRCADSAALAPAPPTVFMASPH